MLVGKQFPKHSVKTKSIARNQLPSLHFLKSRRSEDLPFAFNTKSMIGEILFSQTNHTFRRETSDRGALVRFYAMQGKCIGRKTLIESLLREQL